MLLNTFLPGASYSAGAWHIPVSAVNSVLTSSVTGKDSAELLIFSLLEVLYQRQKDGFLTQPTISLECSNRAIGQSVWEEAPNNFSNCDLLSWLVSVNLDSSPSISRNDIHPTT
jgi:hypothetical protein